MEDLNKAARDIYSTDLNLQLEAVTEFRKKLSKGTVQRGVFEEHI